MYNAPMFGPPVFVNRKDLKRAAKEDLRTARPRVWKVTLVYLLLTSGLFLLLDLALSGSVLYGRDLLAALLTSTDPQQLLNVLAVSAAPVAVPVFFLQILLQLYAAVLEFGYCGYTLRRSRGEAASFRDLLGGFGMAGRVIVMNLIVLAFSLCWAFLVLVPVTLAVSFLMSLFLVGVSIYATPEQLVGQLLVFYPVILVIFIAAALLILFLTLRYALAPFCLADRPDSGPLEAVRRSRALLSGRYGEIFKLVLSFLGWTILSAVLSGLVSGVCVAAGCLFFLSSGSLTALTAGIVAGEVLAFVLPLPLTIWLTGYRTGTLARYYCAISADVSQPSGGQPIPGDSSWPL